jgi:PAS domain S-box-containing protein
MAQFYGGKTGTDGKIVYANKAFKKLTGYSRAEVIGKAPRVLQGAGTDEKVTDSLSKALKSGGKFEGKAINYKKYGTPFIMYWRVLPIKVGKKIEAWVAIQREGPLSNKSNLVFKG